MNQSVKEAIGRYQAVFNLIESAVPFGDPLDSFRIDHCASYVNDDGDVQLVLERCVNGQWLQYGKVYPAELDDNIVRESASMGSIDITPVSLTTPEGITRVNLALRQFEDSTAIVANAATQFIKSHNWNVLPEGVDDLAELREAILDREAKQDAMLRALAGR